MDTFGSQNDQVLLFCKIRMNLLFLRNNQRFITFLKLEFHKKWYNKFEGYFFKELEFLELKLYGKLEFKKNGRLLNI